MSTNSDRLRRITYKSPYGKGILVWRAGMLFNHELPGYRGDVPAASDEARTSAEKNLVRQLEEYFVGVKNAFDIGSIPIDHSRWTRFRARVFMALGEVPYGTTISYAELAAAAGHPRACRAVGSCLAMNPYPVIIPCHRVVRSDGSLGNFSWGAEWKSRLLGIEGLPFPGMGESNRLCISRTPD